MTIAIDLGRKATNKQTNQVQTLGHDSGDKNENCIWYVFKCFIFENSHKVWYKNLWYWLCNWNLMIIDLVTSPQGHQFDLKVKILLAFCSYHPPVNLICHMTIFEKKNCFDPLGTHDTPKSHPGAWSRRQNKNPVRYVSYLLYVRTHTKFGIKNFEIDLVIKI